jgi:serine/threonine protein kinase
MLSAGDRIGDWVIERALGEGGMGTVYLATNSLTERIRAAVKVIKPRAYAAERERFTREVEALDSLRHEAIVGVKGWGEDPERGLLWMAMDLVEGEEVAHVLERGPMSLEAAATTFSVVADGLQYAHERGFRHRDIKPANILIDAAGIAHLVDFGIAVESGRTRLTAAGKMPGTPSYMAPEVFEEIHPDPSLMDVYSLGQVLYEALVGEFAFPENTELASHQQIVHLIHRKVRSESLDPGPQFPETVRDLVKAATHPRPAKRLSNPAALRDALIPYIPRHILAKLPLRVTLPPAPERSRAGVTLTPSASDTFTLTLPKPRGRRNVAVWAIGGLGTLSIAGALVGGLYMLNQPPDIRDAIVVVAGISADVPVMLSVNGNEPTSYSGQEYWFEGVPTGPMMVSVAAGAECDFLSVDGETCPACCACHMEEYTLEGGFEPDMTLVTLPDLGDISARTLAINVVELPEAWPVQLMLDGAPVAESTTGRDFTWTDLPLGAYELTAVVGTCPESAHGCANEGTCPGGCTSRSGPIGLACGDGAMTLDIAMDPPFAAPPE